MNIREKILRRRKALHLTEGQVSDELGITIESYGDIELYDDEIQTVADLGVIKKLCSLLKVSFFDLLEMRCSFCVEHMPYEIVYGLPRNELIKKALEKLHLSEHELAERIGFEDMTVHQMKEDEFFLETWSLDLIRKLAVEIQSPFQILAGVRCPRCGK